MFQVCVVAITAHHALLASQSVRKADSKVEILSGGWKDEPAIVDAIPLAYASLGLQCPIVVRDHPTRGMASWAW